MLNQVIYSFIARESIGIFSQLPTQYTIHLCKFDELNTTVAETMCKRGAKVALSADHIYYIFFHKSIILTSCLFVWLVVDADLF
jgi:hypothetical protein